MLRKGFPSSMEKLPKKTAKEAWYMWLRLSAIKLCLGKPRSSNKVRIGKPSLDQNNVKVFSEFAFGTDLLATRESVEKNKQCTFLCLTLGWVAAVFPWFVFPLFNSRLNCLSFLCLTPGWVVGVFADHSCFLCLTLGWVVCVFPLFVSCLSCRCISLLCLSFVWLLAELSGESCELLWVACSALIFPGQSRPRTLQTLREYEDRKKHFLSAIFWKGPRVIGH